MTATCRVLARRSPGGSNGSKRAVDRQRGILFDKCQCVIRVLSVLKFRIVQAKRLSQGVE
jgi:hypothetical protein